MLTIFDFTPGHALIGGALLGSATVMRMWLTGRILGVSGIAGGIVRGQVLELQRWLFTAGLVAGGVGLTAVYPYAFGEVTMPVWRALVGGLLVGLGAGMGNGCTSGHGISGNARLSPRSMVRAALPRCGSARPDGQDGLVTAACCQRAYALTRALSAAI
jgi:hypothetical protein